MNEKISSPATGSLILSERTSLYGKTKKKMKTTAASIPRGPCLNGPKPQNVHDNHDNDNVTITLGSHVSVYTIKFHTYFLRNEVAAGSRVLLEQFLVPQKVKKSTAFHAT